MKSNYMLTDLISSLRDGPMRFREVKGLGCHLDIQEALRKGLVEERCGTYRLTPLGQQHKLPPRREVKRDLRYCPDCRQVKLREEFWAMPSSSDGCYAYCKPCAKRRRQRWTTLELKPDLPLPLEEPGP